MKEEDKILHMVLNYDKYEKIATGKENCVYLPCIERWNNLFVLKKYRKARLSRGLYKNPQTMLLKVKNISLYYGQNYLNKPKVWIVRLGERIDQS